MRDPYFDIKALSQSTLNDLRRAILLENQSVEKGFALFREMQKQAKEGKALDFGGYYHCINFEPKEIDNRFFLIGDLRLKENKELKQKAIESGLTIISDADYQLAKEMQTTLFKSSKIRDIIDHDNPFISFEQQFEFDYLDCKFKMKIDIVDDLNDTIYDLKTTKEVSPKSLGYSNKDYGYYIQKFIYKKGLEILRGKEYDFKFIFQEKTYPYAFRIVNIDKSQNELAEREVFELVNIYKRFENKEFIFDGLSEITI